MASVRQIARRIRSVENTAKITKAMAMIAASKLGEAKMLRPKVDLTLRIWPLWSLM